MILYLFHDRITGDWHSPVLARSELELFRTIRDTFKGTRHPFSLHSADIDVYSSGSVDSQSGIVDVSGGQNFVAHLNELLADE